MAARATVLSASYWHVQPKSNAKIAHDARYVVTLRAPNPTECALLVSTTTGMNFAKLAYARQAMGISYVVAKN